MPIQRTYTGRSSSPISPSSADTSGGVGQLLMRANENRQYREEKNEDRYLKYLDVSPETYIANKNTEEQAKMLEEYQAKATQRLKERGNDFKKFTTEDWVFLQQERNKLEAAQERMNTDLKKYEAVSKVMEEDKNGKGLFDQDEWNRVVFGSLNDKGELVGGYLNTGVFPSDFTMPIKAQPFTDALAEQSSKIYKGENISGEEELKIGGVPHKRPYTVNISEDQAKGLIKDVLLSNDAARKDLYRRFSELPVEEKAKWLVDEDNNKGIDSTEERNGIIRWAQNNPEFIQAAQVKKYGTPTAITQPRATSTKPKGTPVKLGEEWITMYPATKREEGSRYSDQVYPTSYGFSGTTTLSNVPVEGAKKVSGTTSRDFGARKGNVSGKLKEYVVDASGKEWLIVEALTSDNSLRVESKDDLAIPIGNVIGANSFPVADEKGNTVTIGDLRKKSAQSTTTAPTNKWEKYLKK